MKRALMWMFAVAMPLVPAIAEACSPPCDPGYAAPTEGATIPASVSAIALLPPLGVNPGGDLLAVDGGGGLITTMMADPAVPRGLLLVPKQPLVAGTKYQLSWQPGCQMGGGVDGGEGVTTHQRFTVGAAAPLPTKIGQASLEAQKVGMIEVGTASGSCTTMIDAASAKLAITPGDELRPFLPITLFVLTVDGKQWASTWYGAVAADGTVSGPFGGKLTRLHARCVRAPGSSDDDGLAVDQPHHAVLTAHVAGAMVDPAPLAFDFMLGCAPPANGDDGVLADLGAPFPDGGARGGPDLAVQDLPPKPAGGGCSIDGGRQATTLLVSALVLLALVAGLRRRQS